MDCSQTRRRNHTPVSWQQSIICQELTGLYNILHLCLRILNMAVWMPTTPSSLPLSDVGAISITPSVFGNTFKNARISCRDTTVTLILLSNFVSYQLLPSFQSPLSHSHSTFWSTLLFLKKMKRCYDPCWTTTRKLGSEVEGGSGGVHHCSLIHFGTVIRLRQSETQGLTIRWKAGIGDLILGLECHTQQSGSSSKRYKMSKV